MIHTIRIPNPKRLVGCSDRRVLEHEAQMRQLLRIVDEPALREELRQGWEDTMAEINFRRMPVIEMGGAQ